jgi:hypothetical protein
MNPAPGPATPGALGSPLMTPQRHAIGVFFNLYRASFNATSDLKGLVTDRGGVLFGRHRPAL